MGLTMAKRKRQPRPAWTDVTCFHCREIVPEGDDLYWDYRVRYLCPKCYLLSDDEQMTLDTGTTAGM